MTRNDKFNLVACLIAAMGGAILGTSMGGWLGGIGGAVVGFLFAMGDNLHDRPAGPAP